MGLLDSHLKSYGLIAQATSADRKLTMQLSREGHSEGSKLTLPKHSLSVKALRRKFPVLGAPEMLRPVQTSKKN